MRIKDSESNGFISSYSLVGGGGSESMDRWGCAILALEVIPKNLISHKNPTQKFILQDFTLAISARKTMPH